MIRICSLWSSAATKWEKANWTWSECELIEEICSVWGTTGIDWSNLNWWWSSCSGSLPPIPPTPAIDIGYRGVDATTLIQPWMEEPWNPYRDEKKKRRLIKLICKVKGQKYEEEKEIKEFNVSIDDIQLVIKSATGVDIKTKMSG